MSVFKKIIVMGALVAVGAFANSSTSQAGGSAGACSAVAAYSSTYAGCSGDSASASSAVTSSESVAISAAQTVGLISGRISALTNSQTGSKMASNNGKGTFSYNLGIDEDGKSAGGADQKFGVWISGAWSKSKFNDASTKYDGTTANGMFGVDYRVTDGVLVGVAAGYESSDMDTKFNEGNEDSKGYTGALYALFNINKTYSVDVTGGYSSLDYDMDRIDSNVRSTITGETDGKRMFGSVNANGNWAVDNWKLGTNVGVLYAREKKDGFTESGTGATTVAANTTTLGRARIGGDIGYTYESVTPYARANFNYDFKDGGSIENSSADNQFLDYGLGVRLNLGNGVSGIIEGTGIAAKSNLSSYGANASLRVQF